MGDNSDLDQQIEQLRKCEVIKESDVKILCAKAREILGKLEINLVIQVFLHLRDFPFKLRDPRVIIMYPYGRTLPLIH